MTMRARVRGQSAQTRVDDRREPSSVTGRRMKMLRVAVGLLASILVCSCSSGYEPARSPRIAMVVDGGTPTFVKDGTRYRSTFFAGGLVDAVRGNPRAEEQACI